MLMLVARAHDAGGQTSNPQSIHVVGGSSSLVVKAWFRGEEKT